MTVRGRRTPIYLLCGFILIAGEVASASGKSVDRLTQAALSLDAHTGDGAAKYMQYCSQCHGAKGQGDAEHGIPALAGQRFNYLVRQISNFGIAQRDNAPKAHVISDKTFSEPQTWDDLAAYLSRLTAAQVTATGDGRNLALGRGIFHEQCATCHQADAGGDKEGFVPSLRNQHYLYLVHQLHRLAEGHRLDVDQNLTLFMRSFDAADKSAVADYLSRLRGPGVPDEGVRRFEPAAD